MKTRTHIAYKTFLETFWTVPAASKSPHLRQTPAPNHYAVRAFRQTIAKVSERQERTPREYMRWLVDKLKLCPNHSLCLDKTPSDGRPGWGHMEPINDSRPAWARPQVLFLFVKDSESPGPSEPYRHEDIITKAHHHFTVQHITSLFIVVVSHDLVQPVRCDRSGTVLSQPENYIRDPSVLPDLFWRLSVLTEEQLGLDPMAIPVLPGTSDYNFMQNLARGGGEIDIPWHDGATVPPKVVSHDPVNVQYWGHARSWFQAMLNYADDDFKHDKPLWKLIVPNDEDPEVPREFLVGVPLAYRTSAGASVDERNTRIFVAYDLEQLKFVCLKDTWREVVADGFTLEREGEVLRKLNGAGVPYVPTLVCESDLPGQDTRTPEFWTKWDAFPDKESPTKLRHYRMVTEEICLQLSEVQSSRQLVSVMHDCITAHASAAERLGLLHGDISYHNMLICPTVDKTNPDQPTVKWRGMLMDWEFPRLAPTDENKGLHRPHGRRSWKFTSIAYMHSPDKPLTVADELESFFYVILYTAALHLPSNLTSPDGPKRFIDGFFSAERSNDSPCGWAVSQYKRLALRQARVLSVPTKGELRFYWRRRRPGESRAKPEPLDRGLNALLQEYLAWCHAGYVQSAAGQEPCHNLPRTYRSPTVEGRDVGELARKLERHDALRALFEDALRAWPEERDEEVVKSEPREEGVPAEEFWKAMAQMGGVGEGTEPAREAEPEVDGECGVGRRKPPIRTLRDGAEEKGEEEEARTKGGRGTKRRAKDVPAAGQEGVPVAKCPTRSSRRIRGEPAPAPEEAPAKRRRRG